MVKKTSLFIGRFDPFHEGHKFIVDSLLAQGDKVVIGFKREMDFAEFCENIDFIRGIYPKQDVSLSMLRSFDRIVHGRTTGYTYERVKTPKRIELISATKIRRSLKE